jgi:hypothetical protein
LDAEDRLVLQSGHERQFVEGLDVSLGFDFIELDEDEPTVTNVVEMKAFVDRVNAAMGGEAP